MVDVLGGTEDWRSGTSTVATDLSAVELKWNSDACGMGGGMKDFAVGTTMPPWLKLADVKTIGRLCSGWGGCCYCGTEEAGLAACREAFPHLNFEYSTTNQNGLLGKIVTGEWQTLKITPKDASSAMPIAATIVAPVDVQMERAPADAAIATATATATAIATAPLETAGGITAAELYASITPACSADEAVFPVIWRPGTLNDISNAVGNKAYILCDRKEMPRMPDTTPAAKWLRAEALAAISKALDTYTAETVKSPSASEVAAVKKTASFDVSRNVLIKALADPDAGYTTFATAKKFDSIGEMEAAATRMKLKAALRRAVPCGHVVVDEVVLCPTGSLKMYDISGASNVSSHNESRMHKHGAGAARAARASKSTPGNAIAAAQWAGIRVAITPGTSAAYEVIEAKCTKPSKDAKFGVQLTGGSATQRSGQEEKVAAEAAVSLPRITSLGPVLEGCGLVEGDELMWINHTECTGSVDQCVEALKGADAGELTVIARRKKREVDVEVKVGP